MQSYTYCLMLFIAVIMESKNNLDLLRVLLEMITMKFFVM